MTDSSELERVLAALDKFRVVEADAARLLREMRSDFEAFTDHHEACEVSLDRFRAKRKNRPCGCGLDTARERWTGLR